MSDYASLTVAQLKEALKAKGLATDGKKAELVARLEALGPSELDDGDDDQTLEAAAQEPSVLFPGEPSESTSDAPAVSAPSELSAPSAESFSASTGANGDSSKPTQAAAVEKKVLSPEERKALAVDILNKKIKRADKFGDEAAAAVAKKDLMRVQKFGVDPNTALAKEIGVLDREVNTELSTKRARRGNGKSRRRSKTGRVGKSGQ
ncbi:hypothetical protein METBISCDRAFT_25806 [Metschnikowia bicuspidata]|uniref:SAP domain-containing protein n=1 Tax=Metschnikowia bicuspidata TaxID=27322 RepID=A0A4V1J3J6_9ASCO|nr:hypothetical protein METBISCDRAFT_25806 [Metschnikowia bicuspidata]